MGWLSRVWLFVGTTKNVEIYLLLTTVEPYGKFIDTFPCLELLANLEKKL